MKTLVRGLLRLAAQELLLAVAVHPSTYRTLKFVSASAQPPRPDCAFNRSAVYGYRGLSFGVLTLFLRILISRFGPNGNYPFDQSPLSASSSYRKPKYRIHCGFTGSCKDC